ncbi:hypothetical protein [Paractinoplanes atraurantiacus]|uniref:Predicted ATPase n=1 Tax=Paractinoplanes atraurantiacus TaxID=1036182 RepID=A0A285J4G0_9ACTN|nr:hypothetical protein [Actinoplanes atraurantiacus]SNY55230.1 Predicted ATPase [Actinoplanes atraurantiacus]
MSLSYGYAELPDPARAGDLDGLVGQLRALKVWAGDPSYATIMDRVNADWAAAGRPASELAIRSTVAHCFQPGRRRLNTGLVVAIVGALHPDTGYVAQWRQTLRVIGGETRAASQVRVQDSLPLSPAAFIGRTAELEHLGAVLAGGTAATVTIEGMAGVGKTELALHAGRLADRRMPFDRVLFVDLRGFHSDPAQPPADPGAVLDGFLRLLDVPGHRIPHGLAARVALYRRRLYGARVLVVLDNAAGADQVRPLVPGTPGSLSLVTSRRHLGLSAAAGLTVGVFSPQEAVDHLTAALPGADRPTARRIARGCGHLPLALGLIAGHIRGTPGWTLSEHADRLGERLHDHRLDSGVELALSLSYQHLPGDRQRLMRLLALHPGHDFDAYAAAALTGTDPGAAEAGLAHLHGDHLLQSTGPGRYTFHDLVRAYAVAQARDHDPPGERRTALTRMFDHYLATTAAAMNTLEHRRRPRTLPPGVPVPDLTSPGDAIAWLEHTNRFARTLFAA